MANSSSTVSTSQVITAAQYNNLRTDAIGPYGDERVFPDSTALKFGTGEDATIQYNGTDLVIAPAAVGAGDVHISGGSLEVDDSEAVRFGTGKDASISYDGTNLLIQPQDVGTGDVVINDAAILFVNETANTGMTTGLTLNQGQVDDEILALKAGADVAHGMTTISETDTYGFVKKIHADGGGLDIVGLADTGEVAGRGLRLQAYSTPTTTDTTASHGVVDIYTAKPNGTGIQSLGTTENAFGVNNNNSGLFLIKGNGDIHGVDTDGATALDAFDDAALLRTVEVSSSRKGVILDEWDNFVKYNEQDLIDAGLYSSPRSEGGMLNLSQLWRLQNGAIWQLAKRNMALVNRVETLEREMKALA